jgi:hypothetical protein
MTDFLTRLVGRSLGAGTLPRLQPVVASRFAPDPAPSGVGSIGLEAEEALDAGLVTPAGSLALEETDLPAAALALTPGRAGLDVPGAIQEAGPAPPPAVELPPVETPSPPDPARSEPRRRAAAQLPSAAPLAIASASAPAGAPASAPGSALPGDPPVVVAPELLSQPPTGVSTMVQVGPALALAPAPPADSGPSLASQGVELRPAAPRADSAPLVTALASDAPGGQGGGAVPVRRTPRAPARAQPSVAPIAEDPSAAESLPAAALPLPVGFAPVPIEDEPAFPDSGLARSASESPSTRQREDAPGGVVLPELRPAAPLGASAPRLDAIPLENSAPRQGAPPQVRVSIGRIEVRGAPAPPAPEPAPSPGPDPLFTLEQYLQQREGAGR